MDDFLLTALQQMLEHAPRRLQILREICESSLAALAQPSSSPSSSSSSNAPNTPRSADAYMRPFVLACESRHVKLTHTSIYWLQKLIAYGCLVGDGASGSDLNARHPHMAVLDTVLQTVCTCYDLPDDDVQLEIIKVLVTAVGSASCEVHEATLLNSVRACYRIHLIARNPVNRTTAKANLTQMLSSIFQKMETKDAALNDADLSQQVNANGNGKGKGSGEVEKMNGEIGPEGTGTGTGAAAEEEKMEEGVVDSEAASEDHHGQRLGSGEGEGDGEGEGKEGDICVETLYPSVASTLSSVVISWEREGEEAGKKKPSRPVQLEFRSVEHKDAYLLFRALCRLSMKSNGGGGEAEADAYGEELGDAKSLKSKTLSLDLLLSILENSGNGFRSNKMFLSAIRQYLCPSLIKNCLSTNTRVVGVSLQIFVALQGKLKDELKEEVEVFIAQIFLKIVQSPNSPIDHKILVLELFMRFCKDVGTLVELFLNYDCDWERLNLFSEIVKLLSDIATRDATDLEEEQSKPKPKPKPANQSSPNSTPSTQNALQLMALNSLVAIVRSLSTYTASAQLNVEDGRPAASSITLNESEDEDTVVGSEEGTTLEQGQNSVVGSPRHSISGSVPEDSDDQSKTRNAVGSYVQKKRFQRDLSKAAAKFLIKPKLGIALLVSSGYVQDNPNDIAKFLLKYQEQLSKTQIGEYLGGEKEQSIQCMYAYVDLFDFHGMSLDAALRYFLAGFRLPGEGQKIDRMMEKFASRFVQHNPNIFPSADTAFVLSYAIIMLNTDAHNPNIKPEKKMTKDSFLRQNRGIAGGRDLPAEYLSAIYDRIVSNAISLKEDDDMRANRQLTQTTSVGLFGASEAALVRQRKLAYAKERHTIVASVNSMIKRHGTNGTGSTFISGSDTAIGNDHVRPMFEICWGPLCATFSVNLQKSDDLVVVGKCISGMKLGIRIACRFDMQEERDTLVETLAKSTLLDTLKPLHQKNLDCIKALIAVAEEEGNFLGASWAQILMCISHLTRLQNTDDIFSQPLMNTPTLSTNLPQSPLTFGALFGSGVSHEQMAKDRDEKAAAQVAREVRLEDVERLFVQSVNLSSEAITAMVGALIDVSCVELQSPLRPDANHKIGRAPFDSQARTFSLQKLVEVADFNMQHRPRFVWNAIWSLLSEHFAAAGCHKNQHVSMYAVDSLRQLSVKFLNKEELIGFSFQAKFLKPFELIIARAKTDKLKELVLSCVESMILGNRGSIKSGWESILSVLSIGGADDSAEVVRLAFAIVEPLVVDHIKILENNLTDLVNCLLAFAMNPKVAEESPRAIDLLEASLDNLLAEPSDGDGDGDVDADLRYFSTDNADLLKLWPLIIGLATLIGDSRLAVRRRAVSALFGKLNANAERFSPDLWDRIMSNALLPIFGQVRYIGNPITEEAAKLLEPTARNNPKAKVEAKASPQKSVSLEDDTPIEPEAAVELDVEEGGWNGLAFEAKRLKKSATAAPISSMLESGVAWSKTTCITTLSELVCLVSLLYTGQRVSSSYGSRLWAGSVDVEPADHVLEARKSMGGLGERADLVRMASKSDGVVEGDKHQHWLKRVRECVEASLFGDLLDLFEDLILRDNDAIARIGVACLHQFLIASGKQFSPLLWHKTCKSLAGIFECSTPIMLQDVWEGKEDELPFDEDHVLTMCVVQLQLLQALGDAVASSIKSIGETEIMTIIEVYDGRAEFAKLFNENIDVRMELLRRGFMRGRADGSQSSAPRSPPNLLRQESIATSRLIQILFLVCENSVYSQDLRKMAENKLKTSFTRVVQRYLRKDAFLTSEKSFKPAPPQQKRSGARMEVTEGEKDLRSFHPIVLQGLRKVLEWPKASIAKHLHWVFPLLTALMECANRDVHAMLRKVFEKHIVDLLELQSFARLD